MLEKGVPFRADIQAKKDVDHQALYGHEVRTYMMLDCSVSICDDAYRSKTEEECSDSRSYAQQVACGLLLHAQKQKKEESREIIPHCNEMSNYGYTEKDKL